METPVTAPPDGLETPTGLNKTIGASGTSIFGGIITGEEYNRRLMGVYGLRQFDIMRRSEPSVEAALEVIKQPILNVERDVQPASDEEIAEFKARHVKRELFDRKIDLQQVFEEALTFLDFGFCVMEFTLELVDFEGQMLWGIQEISYRKQTSIESWEIADGKPGVTQILSTTANSESNIRKIPRRKLIIWTNKKEGDNYEGISLLRYAFKDWDMKDKLGLVHAVGLEKMAIPTPVVTMPATTNQPEQEAAERSLRQYRANEESFIKIPDGWKLDKFDMSGQSLRELLPALQYYDRQMYMSVLAGFLALGSSDASGSKAVGEVQYKPYQQKVATVNRRLQAPINEFIKLLCDLNWTDMSEGYPELNNARFQDDDITALANAAKSLQEAGMITPDFEIEKHVRKTLHFPEADDSLQEMYDLKQKQAKEMIVNPPELVDPNVDPKAPPKPNKDAKTKAAVHRAQLAKNGLISEILTR